MIFPVVMNRQLDESPVIREGAHAPLFSIL